jgi:hypothetical protein
MLVVLNYVIGLRYLPYVDECAYNPIGKLGFENERSTLNSSMMPLITYVEFTGVRGFI